MCGVGCGCSVMVGRAYTCSHGKSSRSQALVKVCCSAGSEGRGHMQGQAGRFLPVQYKGQACHCHVPGKVGSQPGSHKGREGAVSWEHARQVGWVLGKLLGHV